MTKDKSVRMCNNIIFVQHNIHLGCKQWLYWLGWLTGTTSLRDCYDRQWQRLPSHRWSHSQLVPSLLSHCKLTLSQSSSGRRLVNTRCPHKQIFCVKISTSEYTCTAQHLLCQLSSELWSRLLHNTHNTREDKTRVQGFTPRSTYSYWPLRSSFYIRR